MWLCQVSLCAKAVRYMCQNPTSISRRWSVNWRRSFGFRRESWNTQRMGKYWWGTEPHHRVSWRCVLFRRRRKMTSCPSFRPHGTTRLHWADFREINPLNSELNPTCHLLALLGAHHILHVSGVRVNIGVFIENLSKIQVSLKSDENNG